MAGIVAIVTRSIRFDMEFGFADRSDAIMTLAAASKHFLMIIERNDRETLWCVTGLTGIAGRDVCRWLLPETGKILMMAINAI